MLHGIPAADFDVDELIYLPRNPRPHRLYGMSPVEQIALTVNIALRRDMATLDYYHAGSTPDAFATLPKDWTLDQIKQFQDYFDALMSGNLARRRMVKFMPAEFRLTETRQPPLKDQYDEWLARVICYAFSIPPSAFVSQVNRATSESLRIQASQEGLVPLKAWVKGALDHIVQVCLKQPDLEFAWVGDDMVDPLQQAQTLSILVGAGIKTKEEARADLGLAPEPTLAPGGTPDQLGKYNPYRDEDGRYTTPPNAVPPGSKPPKTDGSTGAGGDKPGGSQPSHNEPGSQPGAQPKTPPAQSPVSSPGTAPAASPAASSPAPDPASQHPDAPAPSQALYVSPAASAYQVAFDGATKVIEDAAKAAVDDVVVPIGKSLGQRLSLPPIITAITTVALAGAALLASTSSTGGVREGAVPERPDITYKLAGDTQDIAFSANIDGTWRTILSGTQNGANGVYYDSQGSVVAFAYRDANNQTQVAANLSALDGAVAHLKASATGADAGAPGIQDNGPNTGAEASKDLWQVYFNPETQEIRVAPAGAHLTGGVPPGFVAGWTFPKGETNPSLPDPIDPSTSSATPPWQPPPEALAKIPQDWGPPVPNKIGVEVRWFDPRGRKVGGIRIDSGDPNSPFPSQQVPHVVVRSNGTVIGSDGTPIIGPIRGNAVDAHIPLDEWLKWRYWNKP